MLSFPNAKINLGLNIYAKREDGFHELESVFYPISWCDILEVLPSNKLSFDSTGLSIPGNKNDNLCVKAYNLLANDFDLEPVSIHLYKCIPMGAGLGGGSSDAASMIKSLNQLFELKLSQNQMLSYARKLGSDCAFFIYNKSCLATGLGDVLNPFNIDLNQYEIFIVYPGIHVNTAWAYSQLVPKKLNQSWVEDFRQHPYNWSTIKNDFEEVILKEYPDIKKLKNNLLMQGAEYACMSGSGSSVFGIFKKGAKIDITSFKSYKYYLHV